MHTTGGEICSKSYRKSINLCFKISFSKPASCAIGPLNFLCSLPSQLHARLYIWRITVIHGDIKHSRYATRRRLRHPTNEGPRESGLTRVQSQKLFVAVRAVVVLLLLRCMCVAVSFHPRES